MTYKDATGSLTPYEVEYGLKPRLPNITQSHHDFGRSIALCRQRWELLLKEARRKQAHQYDRKSNPRSFQPGDWVLKRLEAPLMREGSQKLSPSWEGPFTIVQRVQRDNQPTDLYDIREINGTAISRVNVEKLKGPLGDTLGWCRNEERKSEEQPNGLAPATGSTVTFSYQPHQQDPRAPGWTALTAWFTTHGVRAATGEYLVAPWNEVVKYTQEAKELLRGWKSPLCKNLQDIPGFACPNVGAGRPSKEPTKCSPLKVKEFLEHTITSRGLISRVFPDEGGFLVHPIMANGHASKKGLRIAASQIQVEHIGSNQNQPRPNEANAIYVYTISVPPEPEEKSSLRLYEASSGYMRPCILLSNPENQAEIEFIRCGHKLKVQETRVSDFQLSRLDTKPIKEGSERNFEILTNPGEEPSLLASPITSLVHVARPICIYNKDNDKLNVKKQIPGVAAAPAATPESVNSKSQSAPANKSKAADPAELTVPMPPRPKSSARPKWLKLFSLCALSVCVGRSDAAELASRACLGKGLASAAVFTDHPNKMGDQNENVIDVIDLLFDWTAEKNDQVPTALYWITIIATMRGIPLEEATEVYNDGLIANFAKEAKTTFHPDKVRQKLMKLNHTDEEIEDATAKAKSIFQNITEEALAPIRHMTADETAAMAAGFITEDILKKVIEWNKTQNQDYRKGKLIFYTTTRIEMERYATVENVEDDPHIVLAKAKDVWNNLKKDAVLIQKGPRTHQRRDIRCKTSREQEPTHRNGQARRSPRPDAQ